jgi:hypothetical protein
MKSFASRFLAIVLKLSTALAACLGCSKQADAPKPRGIHWRGPETGYKGTTVIEPEGTTKIDQEEHP